MAGSTTAHRVLISPASRRTRYLDSMVTWKGSSIRITYRENSTFLPRNRYTAKAHAAGTATASCPSRMLPVIPREFQNSLKKAGEKNRSRL